jgi:transcriptional regulator GlxA family with amidase domain
MSIFIQSAVGLRKVKSGPLLKWIADMSAKTKITASVCTGSSLLGKAGLLDGRESTTHWRAFDFLREAAPKTKIRRCSFYSDRTGLYFCRSFCGNRFGLTYSEPFFGTEVGEATAQHMEYPYPQSDTRRSRSDT